MESIDMNVINDIIQSILLIFISAGKLKKPKGVK